MFQKKKESKDKALYAAVRELSELQRISWNAPLIKLPKKIQTGWTKTLVLRDDCRNRKDFAIYQTILDKVKIDVFCRKADFINSNGRPINTGIKIIRTNEWKDLNWPDSYKKYFEFGTFAVETYGRTQYIEGYRYWQRFYFVDKIVPYFITHTQAKLPEVETRIAELKSYIEKHGGWDRYYRYKNGSSGKKGDWDYSQKRFDVVEEIFENQIKDCIIYGNDEERVG